MVLNLRSWQGHCRVGQSEIGLDYASLGIGIVIAVYEVRWAEWDAFLELASNYQIEKKGRARVDGVQFVLLAPGLFAFPTRLLFARNQGED